MEKLLSSRTDIPELQSCEKCSGKIDKPAIKCEQCKQYTHVSCTSLPYYAAIRYFTSRTQYVCGRCVESNLNNYGELLDWIEDLWKSDGQAALDQGERTEARAENSTQLAGIMEAVNDIRQKLNRITPTTDLEHSKKPSYAEITRPSTPDSVQHVLVKPKDPSKQPKTSDISSALKTVPISRVSTNSSGHLRITLPHAKAKSDAMDALSASQEVVACHEIVPVKKILPKITISSVPSDIDDKEIKQYVRNKNSVISDLISAGENFEVLFSRPSGGSFKSVTVRVTPLLREAIMQTSLLYIDTMRCRVYDRYWVSRCGNCQRFGHTKAACRTPEPKCTHCAGNHLSTTCPDNSARKCCNCIASSRTEVDHKASSTNCPLFILAKDALIKKTMTLSDVSSKN